MSTDITQNGLQMLKEYINYGVFGRDAKTSAEILEAYHSNDNKLISLFEKLGPSARHRVMNLDQLRRNIIYGSDSIELGKYNWLEPVKPVSIEIISLKTPSDNAHFNKLELGKYTNGFWSYGYTFTFGSAGQSCGVSVWKDPYDNRQRCFDAAITYAENTFKQHIGKNDHGNYNQTYINKVLAEIYKLKNAEVQLQFF
ncbi:hypothetical protein ACJVDH_00215 [Pedobacter sp. AW1-32]|uniref:hypothetical protein n=1 Tax=Pedobacter sp. AW1-32 TaxID=3383026 RepID=UPI003FF10FF5